MRGARKIIIPVKDQELLYTCEGGEQLSNKTPQSFCGDVAKSFLIVDPETKYSISIGTREQKSIGFLLKADNKTFL